MYLSADDAKVFFKALEENADVIKDVMEQNAKRKKEGK